MQKMLPSNKLTECDLQVPSEDESRQSLRLAIHDYWETLEFCFLK